MAVMNNIRRGYEDICRDLAGAGACIELLSQAENIFQTIGEKKQMEYGPGKKKWRSFWQRYFCCL